MMNNDLNEKKITGGCCGRPIAYAPEKKCNYCDACMSEYQYKMKACIKKDADPCKAKAVIPAITVETTDGLTNLANCFVHVTSINTTFYIDDKHRPMIIWSGDVEVDLPETVTDQTSYQEFVKSFKLREQHLLVKSYDEATSSNVIAVFYFDKTGKIYSAGDYTEIAEGV